MANKKVNKFATRDAKLEEVVRLGNLKKGAAKNCAGINYARMPKELELHDDKSCHKLFPCGEAMKNAHLWNRRLG